MPPAAPADRAGAAAFAKRLNFVRLPGFGLWLGSATMFGLQAFGPLRLFGRAALAERSIALGAGASPHRSGNLTVLLGSRAVIFVGSVEALDHRPVELRHIRRG